MKRRDLGLDIIRCIAVFSVISVHFFLNAGFYDKILNSKTDFLLIFFRSLFFICVPLFLLLTGYLVKQKAFNKKYFLKIFKILISYFIISLIIIFYRKYYLNENITKFNFIFEIFGFKGAPYAWYVEMYVCLFLLIPFLNNLYNNLSNKEKKYLVIILIFITSFGVTFNNIPIFDFKTDLFPDWWSQIYPITYFIIGKYIYENPLEISFSKKLLFLLSSLLLQTIIIFISCYNKVYDWNIFLGYGNLFTLIVSIMVFSIFKNVNIKNKLLSKIITNISLVSFEMYLISYIFDKLFYKNIIITTSLDWFISYITIVPLVFICSYLCSVILNKMSTFLFKKLYYDYNNIIDYLLLGCVKMKKCFLIFACIVFVFVSFKFLIYSNDEYRISDDLSNASLNCFYKKSLKDITLNKIIIIGDSRMELLESHRNNVFIPSNVSFIALSGSKISWLKDEALEELYSKLDENDKKYKYHVVINMGVNDLADEKDPIIYAQEYYRIYHKLSVKYPNVDFCLLSVNPVDDSVIDKLWKNQHRNNFKIKQFNDELLSLVNNDQQENINFCNSYDNIEFKLPDGLHFDIKTDKKIINYISNRCSIYD